MATADPELLEQILATAAAAAVEPTVVPGAAGLRSLWAGAAVVVIGIDQAAAVAASALPRRSEVYVVGDASDHGALCSWSGPIGATVVVLPESSGWLTASLADSRQDRGRGRLVGVLGGSGGVGASTWAAGLALTAAQQDLRTALVDADPLGGGLDLLLGAERSVGWRWPQLAGARGHLGDLTDQLPSAGGCHLLAAGREDRDEPGPRGADQLTAVLQSLSRSHQLIVVDLPRPTSWITAEVVRRCDALVLVARADVRGVSAARAVLDQLREGPPPDLVARARRRGTLAAGAVARALGISLLGAVADDHALQVAAERGDPPPRSARAASARSYRASLRRLTLDRSAA